MRSIYRFQVIIHFQHFQEVFSNRGIPQVTIYNSIEKEIVRVNNQNSTKMCVSVKLFP